MILVGSKIMIFEITPICPMSLVNDDQCIKPKSVRLTVLDSKLARFREELKSIAFATLDQTDNNKTIVIYFRHLLNMLDKETSRESQPDNQTYSIN